MKLPFFKYQGTGNDFILIDNREGQYTSIEKEVLIANLCDRRFGIGADGLILLNTHPNYAFEMRYYNADGRLGSMCGNGGRCVVAFAHFLGMIQTKCSFLAADGVHDALVKSTHWIELKMNDVDQIEEQKNFLFLNTGSPHYIEFVDQLSEIDVFNRGRAIRNNDRFKAEGTNVNFVETNSEGITVATYERGVEAETLSCGTGVTAAAIAHFIKNHPLESAIKIDTKGGRLEVRFEITPDNTFTNIWLSGPAKQVFRGEILID